MVEKVWSLRVAAPTVLRVDGMNNPVSKTARQRQFDIIAMTDRTVHEADEFGESTASCEFRWRVKQKRASSQAVSRRLCCMAAEGLIDRE